MDSYTNFKNGIIIFYYVWILLKYFIKETCFNYSTLILFKKNIFKYKESQQLNIPLFKKEWPTFFLFQKDDPFSILVKV